MPRKYITEDGKIVIAKNFRQAQKFLQGTLFFDAYKYGEETRNFLNEAIKKSIFFIKPKKRKRR